MVTLRSFRRTTRLNSVVGDVRGLVDAGIRGVARESQVRSAATPRLMMLINQVRLTFASVQREAGRPARAGLSL